MTSLYFKITVRQWGCLLFTSSIEDARRFIIVISFDISCKGRYQFYFMKLYIIDTQEIKHALDMFIRGKKRCQGQIISPLSLSLSLYIYIYIYIASKRIHHSFRPLLQITDCHLIGANPFFEPKLNFSHSYPWKQIPVKF